MPCYFSNTVIALGTYRPQWGMCAMLAGCRDGRGLVWVREEVGMASKLWQRAGLWLPIPKGQRERPWCLMLPHEGHLISVTVPGAQACSSSLARATGNGKSWHSGHVTFFYVPRGCSAETYLAGILASCDPLLFQAVPHSQIIKSAQLVHFFSFFSYMRNVFFLTCCCKAPTPIDCRLQQVQSLYIHTITSEQIYFMCSFT